MKGAFVVALLLALPAVQAAITSIEVSTSIEGTTAYVDYIVKVAGPASEVLIPSDPQAQLIYGRDSFGSLDVALEDTALRVAFSRNVSPGETRTVILKTKTAGLVADKGRYFEYVWNVNMPNQAYFQNVLVVPQDTTKIVRASPQAAIDGTAIIWKSLNYRGSTMLAHYERPENYTVYAIGAAVAVGMFLAGVGLVFSRRKQRPASRALLGKVSLMNIKERQVLEALLEKGEANQYELRARLNLTKSNLSKIVKSLELKGLIRRERHGKINRIYPGERLK